jgi:uncharacterized protein YegJ (DUF2314 family)
MIKIELGLPEDGHRCEMHYPPTEEELKRIKPGDHVYLAFKMPRYNQLSKYEKMWVRVLRVERNIILGVLNQDPNHFYPTELKDGDPITTEFKYVHNILYQGQIQSLMETRGNH